MYSPYVSVGVVNTTLTFLKDNNMSRYLYYLNIYVAIVKLYEVIRSVFSVLLITTFHYHLSIITQ